jgi:hypothetical protein
VLPENIEEPIHEDALPELVLPENIEEPIHEDTLPELVLPENIEELIHEDTLPELVLPENIEESIHEDALPELVLPEKFEEPMPLDIVKRSLFDITKKHLKPIVTNIKQVFSKINIKNSKEHNIEETYNYDNLKTQTNIDDITLYKCKKCNAQKPVVNKLTEDKNKSFISMFIDKILCFTKKS